MREGRKPVAQNRKARHDYHIEDVFEAYLCCRAQRSNPFGPGTRLLLTDTQTSKMEKCGSTESISLSTQKERGPTTSLRRKRKLLLHRNEISKLIGKTKEGGFTLVPLSLYFADVLRKGRNRLGNAGARRTTKARQLLSVMPSARLSVPRVGARRGTSIEAASHRRVEIPGVVDVHAHFMPDPVMRKVWAVFDQAQDVYGVDWPVEYRGTDTQRLSQLRELRVCAFTSLVYAHKPGMAAWLNDWCAASAAATPDCLPTATFYPEPGVDEYVASAIDRGARIFKVHLQVGRSIRAMLCWLPSGVSWLRLEYPSSFTVVRGQWQGSSPARGQSVRLSHATRTSS